MQGKKYLWNRLTHQSFELCHPPINVYCTSYLQTRKCLRCTVAKAKAFDVLSPKYPSAICKAAEDHTLQAWLELAVARSCVTTFPWSYLCPCPTPQLNTLAQDSWVPAQPQSFLKENLFRSWQSKRQKSVCDYLQQSTQLYAMTFVIYLANWMILNSNKAAVTVATAEEKLCSTRLNRQ